MADRLGHSLLLDDGDLVLGSDDLVEVDGAANVVQALVLRVLTPLGSDVFATGYGLDVAGAFTQPVAAHIMRELVKLNLVRTLSTDPRVRDVVDIQFRDDPRQDASQPDDEAAAARANRRRRLYEVDVTVQAIDGSTHILDLEIGA